MIRHGRSSAPAVLAAALLLIAAGSAHAHGGGRGRTYTATGPAHVMCAPAPQFYGGFGVPPLSGAPYIVQPLTLQPAVPYAPAQRQVPNQQIRWVRIRAR